MGLCCVCDGGGKCGEKAERVGFAAVPLSSPFPASPPSRPCVSDAGVHVSCSVLLPPPSVCCLVPPPHAHQSGRTSARRAARLGAPGERGGCGWPQQREGGQWLCAWLDRGKGKGGEEERNRLVFGRVARRFAPPLSQVFLFPRNSPSPLFALALTARALRQRPRDGLFFVRGSRAVLGFAQTSSLSFSGGPLSLSLDQFVFCAVCVGG